jgi:hypothetical protein
MCICFTQFLHWISCTKRELLRPALGPTQPLIQWVPRARSSGVKRPRLETDHSPRASAEVKKMCICTSTPTYVFMALWLNNYAQGNFTLPYVICVLTVQFVMPIATEWTLPSVLACTFFSVVCHVDIRDMRGAYVRRWLTVRISVRYSRA